MAATPAVAASPSLDEAEKNAEQLAASGQRELDLGRYQGALGLFGRAYDASPKPGYLLRIAQCHRGMSRWAAARMVYLRYFAQAPDSPESPTAKMQLAEVEEKLQQKETQAAATASPMGPAASTSALAPPLVAALTAPANAPPAVSAPAPMQPPVAGPPKFVWGGAPTALFPSGEKLTGRVVVLDLQTNGLDASVGESLQGAITQTIARNKSAQVVSSAEVRQLLSLDKTKQLLGCNEDTACVAELTSKLNADLLVNGTVGKIGASVTLTLSLVRSKKAGDAARATATVDSVDKLGEALPDLVARLFGWSKDVGARYQLPKAQKGKETSFAIFDLKSTGVPANVVTNLTQILSVEVKRVDGTKVVNREDLLALVAFDKEKQQFGCDDSSCLAEIGGALGVNKLLTGSVGKLADTFVISLVLMDVRKNAADNRYTETFKGEDDQLIRATRHAVRELLGLEVRGEGKLAVSASQTGAEVFVDGEGRGKIPNAIEKVKPGRHAVRIARDGFYDWHGDFYVDPLETTAVWARLSERPQKWYQKWWVWTAAGVVVAGGTTALLFATRPAPTTGTGTVVLP
jgi:TolB-like protein